MFHPAIATTFEYRACLGDPKLLGDHREGAAMTPGENEWAGAGDHAQLYRNAIALIDSLGNLRFNLNHGDVHHYLHTELAIRCQSLSVVLASALATAERDAYGPAFALTRSALEHVVIDKLAFLGQRYVQLFSNVDEETWKNWNDARDNGTAWNDVTDWTRSKHGAVRITRNGLKSTPREDGTQQTIGIHYFLMHGEYSPFVGPPSIQRAFHDDTVDQSIPEEYARAQKALYDNYLRWSSLKASLASNNFADDTYLLRLDVHYRFLSAFTHPHTDVSSLLYGRNVRDWPRYDHYSSELILLYVSVLAVEELQNYYRMTHNPPTVAVQNWEVLSTLCDSASQAASHLWFPGQDPHIYDRVNEVNARYFRSIRTQSQEPLANAATLTPEEIRYYANPLDRLVGLHRSFSEITTGVTYVSPWPRMDAGPR